MNSPRDNAMIGMFAGMASVICGAIPVFDADRTIRLVGVILSITFALLAGYCIGELSE